MAGSGLGFLARSIRGLEWMAASELRARLGAKITALGHREIHFELPDLAPDLIELSVVDDVFLNCGAIGNLDHTRASLGILEVGAKKLDFASPLAKIENPRKIRKPIRFDVVASFIGRRNYNRFEIEEAVGGAISRQLDGVQQSPDTRSDADVSWRVHLREREAYVGLRISRIPLHRRRYKTASRIGTLHPPIAAAMGLLAGLQPYGRFLDPFCGVGTIAIEAARLEPELVGPTVSDIDASMVALARTNAQAAGRMNFVVADAGRLPFAYRSVERVVCNLPWGRTVKQQGTLSSEAMPFWRELGRILHSESRAVVLCEDVEPTADQLRDAGLCLVLRNKISVFGRWPTLSVLVSDSQRYPTPIDEYGMFGEALSEGWQKESP